MRLIYRYILVFALSLLVWSCGDDSVNFTIDGSIAGGETLTLRLNYYDGEKLISQQVGARDGKFEIKGKVQGPTILDLSNYDGSLIAYLYVDKDSDFEIKVDVNNRANLVVTGDDINKRYATFLSDNAEALSSGDMVRINEAVENYIKANPADIASTMLLMTVYDSSVEDNHSYRLFESLSPEAKPLSLVEPFTTLATRLWDQEGGMTVPEIDLVMIYDSIFHFDPKEEPLNLLTFSTSNRSNERRDSILDSLRALHKTNKNIRIIDISIESDTISWKRYTHRDSADWEQAWMPGGVSAHGIDNLSIPAIPYFIIVDSAGVQRMRTHSLSHAIDSIRVLDRIFKEEAKARKEAKDKEDNEDGNDSKDGKDKGSKDIKGDSGKDSKGKDSNDKATKDKTLTVKDAKSKGKA